MLHSQRGPRPPVQAINGRQPSGRTRSSGDPSREIHFNVGARDRDLLILDYLDALGSPRALSVWLLYRSGEHRQLVELVIDPLQYDDAEKYRVDSAATKFLSKCVGLKTGIDLEEVAIASAEEAELRCKKTNQMIRAWRFSGDVSPSLSSLLFRAQRLIADILGPLPSNFQDAGWSRGRTTSAFGDEVASIYKYASVPDVTVSARDAALRVIRDSPHWGAAVLNADGPCSVLQSALNVVSGNVLITVPKSAKTDRVICYEPHMNIRLQLAVGSFIRKRLSKRGVNLNDQTVNQRRAAQGALTGDLATIDLSMASDTIATELVYELLPVDWALKLDSLRSRYTLWPDGSTRKNEKFSSMGNGFTFELESLIFYALASAVTSDVSVYGDDIVLPTIAFQQVSDLLEAVGFSVNKRKSYAVSYFRESCGNDSFGGVSVTPVYLRRLPKTREDVIKLHNAVREWAGRTPPWRSAPLGLARMLAKWRHIHTCPWGPSGYGDGHYHVDFEELTPQRASFGLDGWWFKTYTRASRINRLYGDRVSGRFSDQYSFAALCAALGPKSMRSVIDSSVDRRQWVYKKTRALASFTWPGIVWA